MSTSPTASQPAQAKGGEINGYVCPDCRTPLRHLNCENCHIEYSRIDGIPILLSKDARFQSALEITKAYDSIYRHEVNVWEKVGRTKEFIKYFSSLLDPFLGVRLLEIGCGEGFLLASLLGRKKFALDLSIEALKVARTRTSADLAVALAERLPFPTGFFDCVTSVGVMSHFLDTNEALQEVRRVLRPGGHYVSLVHVNLTFWERLGMKVSKYIYPRPRPILLSRWLSSKLRAGTREPLQQIVKQPIQHEYTTRSARACLQRNGLKVVDVIHTRKNPSLPLIGHLVVIYVAQKS